jgi:hypothetical protein
MDEWNIGRMGLMEKGILYNILNFKDNSSLPTKIVDNSIFFVAQYSNIPPFHHSIASASGYGK